MVKYNAARYRKCDKLLSFRGLGFVWLGTFSKMRQMKLGVGVIAIILALITSSCSNRLFDSRTDQQIVEDRATERWQLLIKRDLPAAYLYISPGSRETTPEKVYLAGFGGSTRWLDAKPVSSTCDEDLCWVTMAVKYRIYHKYLPKGMVNTREFKEKWVRSDGQWWYLLKK
jgi:hypothetical protein